MVVETYSIFPTKKYNRPPPKSVVLHSLDIFSAPIQIHNHRFYRRSGSRTTSEIIDRLKSSLAEALELYPPVAGTVRTNENGALCIAVDAELNILGTPFLVDMKDTPYAGDAEDLSPRTVFILPPLSSTLAVKVTQFSCGTIAVATSMNHQVSDMRGFLDFLELWAQLARGECVDLTKIPDDWSRDPGYFFSGLIKESPLLPPSPFSLLPAPSTGVSLFLMAPSKISRWKFSKSSMERLKHDFSPSSTSKDYNSSLWISSGDALAALICGAITRAREDANIPRLQGRSSLESQTELIAMAADGRERAPQGNMSNGRYFGNFNPLWSTTVSRTDLLSLDLQSASRVAVAIRHALNIQLSPEAIASKISFFENPKNLPPGRIQFSADLVLTNWCRFDLQGPKLDFGWGKPFYATDGGGTTFPPGYSIMTQEKDSGDIFVLMTVEEKGADGLKADSLLNKYASLVA